MADSVRSRRQPTAIIIREALAVLQPAGHHAQDHLQRREVDHEPELIPSVSARDVRRHVEHTDAGNLAGAENMRRKAIEIDKRLGRFATVALNYGFLGRVPRARGDWTAPSRWNERRSR